MRQVKIERELNPYTFQPIIKAYLGGVYTGIEYTLELKHDLYMYSPEEREQIVKSFHDELDLLATTAIPDITREELDAIRDALKNR